MSSTQPFSELSQLTLLVSKLEQAVLMENQHRQIVQVNQKFCELFTIPVAPQLLIGSDCSNAAEEVKHFFIGPKEFVNRINTLLAKKEKCIGETLRMTNGKVLLRDFIPLWEGDVYIGHLWIYADITQHSYLEELEIQQTVNYFLSSLYNKESVEAILWDVAKNCIGKLGFVDCVIYLYDSDKKVLSQKAAWGPKTTEDNKIVNPIEIPLGCGIVGTVAKTGFGEIVKDTTLDKRYLVDDESRLSEIAVPIMFEGQVMGVIDSEHPEKYFYSEKHLTILNTIASLCAIKIKQLQATIEQENEINRQKLFYEEILNNIPADIAVFDNEHRYLFVNPTGIKDNELRKWIVGKKDEDYCDLRNKPYSIFQSRRQLFNQAVEGNKQVEWEETLIDKDGNPSHHLRKFYPVENNNHAPKLVIGYGINITERKNIENKIRLSEKKFRDLFDNSPALIFTHDMNYRVTSVNAAIQEVLGFTELQVLNRLLPELAIGGEQDPSFLFYKNEIENKNSVKGLVPVYNAQGKLVHLLCHGYKVEPEHGEAYVIVFGQDISDRIKAEKELQREKLISENNAKAKETFLAKVSHEVRTPMSGILGLTDLLYQTILQPQQKHYVTLLKDSAHNLLAIVNEVLDIEKIAAGKMLLEHVPFKLNEKIMLLAELYEKQAFEKKIAFELDYQLPVTATFLGDPFRISQVLGNLLSNAIKFTNEGGVSVKVYTQAASENENTIRFEVKDSGIGIPDVFLKSIFEPFSQAHLQHYSAIRGTGLGLTICKELVEYMKGSIVVESVEGEGSLFIVELPLEVTAAMADNTKPEEIEISYTSIRGKRILLVEDMELNRFLVSEMVKDWGLQLEIVENGQQAVDFLQHQLVDMVLMDIQMPVLNGLDATRLIRQNLENANNTVPVIALTANVFESDREIYKVAGMNAVLSKPFKKHELYEVMLQELTGELSKPVAINKNENEPTANTEPAINLNYLMKVGKNNIQFVLMMLQSFCETVDETSCDIDVAIGNKEWEILGQLVHKLKFALSVVGVETLKNDVTWLEKETKQQTVSDKEITEKAIVFNTQLKALGQKAAALLLEGQQA